MEMTKSDATTTTTTTTTKGDIIVMVNLKNLFKRRSPPRPPSFETALYALDKQQQQKGLMVIGNKRKNNKRKRRTSFRVNDECCLMEAIDSSSLKWLIKNCSTVIVKEEQKKFLNYASLMQDGDGAIFVKYFPSVDHGKGRIYAKGALSLQGFSVKIRETLGHMIYHDIDIVNCHPIILIWICKKYDLLGEEKKAKNLKYYVDNREDVLKMVMETASCERKNAKILMLSLMYGGKWSSWCKRLVGEEGQYSITPPPFIREYAKELSTIATSLSKKFPDFPAPTKKWNVEFSRMSLYIQDVENKILMEMSKFLSKKGYKPGVYMYDGMMVYKEKRGCDDPINPKILRECEKAIEENLDGIKVKLEEKPIGKGFNITESKEDSPPPTKKLKQNSN